MKLAIKTCTLNMPYEEMLDFCVEQGVDGVEIGTGNWSGAPHIDLERMVSSETARQAWIDALRCRGLELYALNCSGNPLAYEKDWQVTEQTFRLAEQLGVKKIVMMSGLPAGCPGDRTPVWITTSWPPEVADVLDYQWNEVCIPKWRQLAAMAADCGIGRIALENHAQQLVYNPETLLRLRGEIGTIIGMNLDPSHLFWMGGDPIEAARVLGEAGAIYHVHGKDSRPERRMAGPNGMLDTKPIEAFRTRAWNYVAVGAGHGEQWWREFFSVVRMGGYDGEVALEMEDLTMPVLDGHLMSLRTLKSALAL
ncbi:MAG: sugar phosphate isomerase/epimerase [Ruminococcaceae bacterium]|nr:sugar phosphate isomerase/epimerase [Oscillospiraceae bacterium]